LCGTSRAVDRCTQRNQPKAARDRPLHVGALGAPDGLEALEGLALVVKLCNPLGTTEGRINKGERAIAGLTASSVGSRRSEI
jgi:hypothetical protein